MNWTSDAAGGGFTTGKPFRPAADNMATQNVKAALAGPDSILSFYKAMLALRNSLLSSARGSYEHPVLDGSVMNYQRKFEGDHAVVVINYGSTAATTNVAALPAGAALVAAYPPGARTIVIDGNGLAQIRLDPQAVRVFSVRR